MEHRSGFRMVSQPDYLISSLSVRHGRAAAVQTVAGVYSECFDWLETERSEPRRRECLPLPLANMLELCSHIRPCDGHVLHVRSELAQ